MSEGWNESVKCRHQVATLDIAIKSRISSAMSDAFSVEKSLRMVSPFADSRCTYAISRRVPWRSFGPGRRPPVLRSFGR